MVLLGVILLSLISSVLTWGTDKDDEWTMGLDNIINYEHVVQGQQADPFFLGMNFWSEEEQIKVDFMLYNRDHPHIYTRIDVKDEKTLDDLDYSLDLKIIIHGWRNGFESPVGNMLKDAYLRKYDVNVIVMDWSSLSFKNYIGSRMAVTTVGEKVAELLEELVKHGLDLDKVHLVGHSLGAHVAGTAGLRMKSGKIGRITGLDPAAPMFEMADYGDMLKPSSAKFVDVIHTCGYMLGMISAIGHADFYPNHGTPAQPGCGYDLKGECSHSRAYELFADSILSSKPMVGFPCQDSTAYDESSCSGTPAPMGELTPRTARGHFYLSTGSEAPYAAAPKPRNYL